MIDEYEGHACTAIALIATLLKLPADTDPLSVQAQATHAIREGERWTARMLDLQARHQLAQRVLAGDFDGVLAVVRAAQAWRLTCTSECATCEALEDAVRAYERGEPRNG